MSVQKSFLCSKNKAKDGKGLKPEDVCSLKYPWVSSISHLDSVIPCRKVLKGPFESLQPACPGQENALYNVVHLVWSKHIPVNTHQHFHHFAIFKLANPESLGEVSSGSSGSGSLPSHLSRNCTWPRSSCDRPNYFSENGNNKLVFSSRVSNFEVKDICTETSSLRISSWMANGSRSPTSDWPDVFSPCTLDPQLQNSRSTVQYESLTSDLDVSFPSHLHVSLFDMFAGRGPITKFVVTLWYRAPELILMDRRQCMSPAPVLCCCFFPSVRHYCST